MGLETTVQYTPWEHCWSSKYPTYSRDGRQQSEYLPDRKGEISLVLSTGPS